MTLYADHLQDLKSSGLIDEIIGAMGCYSMSPAEILRVLKFDPGDISALAFPYFESDIKKSPFLRIKVFPSYKDKEGHRVKYLQPDKSTPHLYILPSMFQHLQDADVPLWIVEGEKKAARAIQDGRNAIGIGGVWSWVKKNSTEPIDDFKGIRWWRRRVYIVPDSDTWDHSEKATQLRRGAYALGIALRDRGAKVSFLKIAEEEEDHG